MPETGTRDGPLVSVLVPTYNRRGTLAEALASLVRQTYGRFEAFVVNDGGEPVEEVVAGFGDARLVLIDRRENRGKAASLNQALERAAGEYVAYLDDDDRYAPHHLATLVEALEARPDMGAAYSDLYKVHCRVEPDGSRTVLGKIVAISRDFDRFFMCYYNLALHGCLMHRRDLLEKTGLYDEDLEVLIDWDMTRRLAFFTDFVHVPKVTGEFYGPVGESDRISYRLRQDRQRYLANLLRIRTRRPAKPWPKMPDLTILFLPERMDTAAAEVLHQVYAWTFMPYTIVLPLPSAEQGRLESDLPNLVRLETPPGATAAARTDAALEACEADFIGVVPEYPAFGPLWIEDALHAAFRDGAGRTAYAMGESETGRPGFVVRRDALCRARRDHPQLGLVDSLGAAGIDRRPPQPKERALPFDRLLQEAEALEADGNWVRAAWLYDRIGERFGNGRWMRERAAKALAEAGDRDDRALERVGQINRADPTVSTLLLEARLRKRANGFDEAVALLDRAARILEGKEPPCN